MIAAGTRFVHLVVIEELTASQAGRPKDGSWCRVRCDCTLRVLKRSRHLRGGKITNCCSMACPFYRAARRVGASSAGQVIHARRLMISEEIIGLPFSDGALANLLGVSETLVRRNRGELRAA